MTQARTRASWASDPGICPTCGKHSCRPRRSRLPHTDRKHPEQSRCRCPGVHRADDQCRYPPERHLHRHR
ncbi:hypothetical protein E4099_00120 [Streptomyces palmae]|uniref:Uncharacterized protein n=1 Tax=Streptomyces palmae TaxID=1701085 RepID=A0A4Z0HJV0_9ACTN|nr:hypothetical protein E4099_00120 [Streptomyces palmae]